MDTGYALFSLCLPERCCFEGKPVAHGLRRGPVDPGDDGAAGVAVSTFAEIARLVHPDQDRLGRVRDGVRHRGRADRHAGTVEPHLSPRRPAAGRPAGPSHQHHGPREALRFINRVQRLTTCVSLYGYAPSVGLDDCLLKAKARATRCSVLASALGRGDRRRGASWPSICNAPRRASHRPRRSRRHRTASTRTPVHAFVCALQSNRCARGESEIARLVQIRAPSVRVAWQPHNAPQRPSSRSTCCSSGTRGAPCPHMDGRRGRHAPMRPTTGRRCRRA